MNIQNGTNLARYRTNQSPRTIQAKTEASTLGSSDPVDDVFMAVAGGVPLVGSLANVMLGYGASRNGMDNLSLACVGGGFANLAGTITAGLGLAAGNSTATCVGLGMLGASALTAGIVSASI